jgi:hypothetical protein
MAYYMIAGKDGALIVDESEALHLYLRKKDASWIRKEQLDPKTDEVVRVDLFEIEDEEDEEALDVFLVRGKDSDNLLTTEEEGGPDGTFNYVLAFLDEKHAKAFVKGELKAADKEQARNAEIVKARLAAD